MDELRHACPQCGGRQPGPGSCAACGSDPVLDLGQRATLELLWDIETRLRDRRSAWHRGIGVAVGMLTVFGLWLVPGYWTLRAHLFAVPFLADQIGLMAVIAALVMNRLDRRAARRRRFPWLEELPPE